MALNLRGIATRIERLEQQLLPPEPLQVSVRYTSIDGAGRVVETFPPSLEAPPDVVVRIAPHFAS